MDQQLRDRVVMDPRICRGKPCIRGTRIEIAIILDNLAAGVSADEIIDAYPQLNHDDIRAALAYAAELSREGVWQV